MLYGRAEDGSKILATPDTRRSNCTTCKTPLIAKCGEIMTWHWAHESVAECDPWREGETEWHLSWKRLVPAVRCEVSMPPHRADMVTPGGIVVEFQHSPISTQEIAEREAFYGRMIWVMDATSAVDRISLKEQKGYHTFRWKRPRPSYMSITKPMYWDLGDAGVMHIKKVYPEPFCGWGVVIPRAEFIRKDLGGSEREGLLF